MFNFGAERRTPKDASKDLKRQTRKTQREMDREMREMEREEARIEGEIKRYAKKGDTASARRLAKELVRARQAKERMLGMKVTVGAMSTRATTMAASHKMVQSVGAASKAMAMANAQIDPVALQQTMRQFAAHSERMEMTEEMMGDLIDDFDGVEDEEVDEYTSQVLSEVASELTTQMGQVPVHSAAAARAPAATAPAASRDPSDAELEQMVARLQR